MTAPFTFKSGATKQSGCLVGLFPDPIGQDVFVPARLAAAPITLNQFLAGLGDIAFARAAGRGWAKGRGGTCRQQVSPVERPAPFTWKDICVASISAVTGCWTTMVA